MRYVMMVVVAVLCAGNLSAQRISSCMSPNASYASPLSLNKRVIDVSAYTKKYQLNRDGYDDPSRIAVQKMLDKKKKSERRKKILKTAGLVMLGGASAALWTAAYAPGYCAIGMYEGLKFMGVGTVKSFLWAGGISSLAAYFSGTCYTIGRLGVSAAAKRFYGNKERQ
ncbi:MAG: hypothetical protein J6T29_03310 [Alphaproteobacteria bacterium]|nr:hypothetical protein [Alphaproteobacteria bacterium]